jgi:hypothetical protein
LATNTTTVNRVKATQQQRKFAADTSVTAERSLTEAKTLIKKYGGTNIRHAETDNEAIIAFEMHRRLIRFNLPYPDIFSFKKLNGQKFTLAQAELAKEKEIRRLWRTLVATIKAKLIAAESGITSFEQEFLAQTVTETGETVSEVMLPRLNAMYERGEMPPMLPPGN